MKGKTVWVVVSCFIIAILVLTSCTTTATTTTATTAATATTTTPTSTTSATSTPTATETPPPTTTVEPQSGGTMRVIVDSLPTVFGLPGGQVGPAVLITSFAQPLLTFDENWELAPKLAKDWEVEGNTITLYLEEGVLFHDLTPCDADAIVWNLELNVKRRKLAGYNMVESIEALDEYTVRINLSEPSAFLLDGLAGGPIFIYSPTAVETNGDDWAKTNPVGTGPFKMVDYQRDVSFTLEKFEEYWEPGKPYLDGVEFQVITDSLMAQATLYAGQADARIGGKGMDPKDAYDVQQEGYSVSGILDCWTMLLTPDSANPDSPFSNQLVREAVEYAIDRPAIAEGLGYGLTIPAFQLGTPKSVFYLEDFEGREYDEDKARELLELAGYGDGFDTTIVTSGNSLYVGVATAIQGYLAVVGIDAELDVADTARFNSITMGTSAWEGMVIATATNDEPGVAHAVTVCNRIRPIEQGGQLSSMARSPELLDLVAQLLAESDAETIESLAKEITQQIFDDVQRIPVTTKAQLIITQSYVHTTYLNSTSIVWEIQNDWMEAH